MNGHLRAVSLAGAVLLTAVACGSGDDVADPVTAERCIVRLHGKGGSGEPATLDDGVAVLAPDGNGSGWGGRQWEYDTADRLAEATSIITAAVDTARCSRYVIHGFSNGASMAAALLCSSASSDDRVVGVIIDDPVTDAATEGCGTPDVPVTIYWTGALDESAPPGTRCDTIDWTCDGDVIRGIDAYAADVGVVVTPSPFDEHVWFVDTPLPITWLA